MSDDDGFSWLGNSAAMQEWVGKLATPAECHVVQALASVRFDEYGTPDRKLPDCPRCEEDELHVYQVTSEAKCLRCGWHCKWTPTVDA